ncbi:hypothetical protein J4466_05150 [Candidatus Pacearchaeota archaeon]|nr:hypothetical protein [Candidatus Pacearchaeota archaeon]
MKTRVINYIAGIALTLTSLGCVSNLGHSIDESSIKRDKTNIGYSITATLKNLKGNSAEEIEFIHIGLEDELNFYTNKDSRKYLDTDCDGTVDAIYTDEIYTRGDKSKGDLFQRADRELAEVKQRFGVRSNILTNILLRGYEHNRKLVKKR